MYNCNRSSSSKCRKQKKNILINKNKVRNLKF